MPRTLVKGNMVSVMDEPVVQRVLILQTNEILGSMHDIYTATHVDCAFPGGAARVASGSNRTISDVDIVARSEGQYYEPKVQAVQAAAGELLAIGTSNIGA